jgi:hypothetical protein
MSDALSIAAVTLTLRNLLFAGVNATVPGADVSTRPPDRARDGRAGNQLNLFLYQASVNGALRNDPPPGVRPREQGHASLPLTLSYLLTAYGADDDDALGHRLLGAGMRVLHDRPLLSADEIRQALGESDLHRQVERVRITSQPLSVEELSRLWTTFQTQYRISAAYQASVVFIDSLRPALAPTPVLTRGPDDAGPVAQSSLESPFPALESVAPAALRPFLLAGDDVVLTGRRLDGTDVHVVFDHPALADPVVAPPPPLTSTSGHELRLPLPATIPAGIGSVAATVRDQDGVVHETNRLPLAVAPSITTPGPVQVQRDASGEVDVSVDVAPDVMPGQRPLLLAGHVVAPAEPFDDASSTLAFSLRLPAGEYLLRVRVAGIDSPAIDYAQTPPRFDPTQRLVVR